MSFTGTHVMPDADHITGMIYSTILFLIVWCREDYIKVEQNLAIKITEWTEL